MIYFTSDWHIGHDKDFCYQARGFNSVEEMDTAILTRCNEIVSKNDELWILGDLAMGGNEKEWERVYLSVNCQNIYFLWGNHDTDNKRKKYTYEYGIMYEGMVDIFKYSKRKSFYLSHYPTIVSNYDDPKYFWNLSGHTHNKNIFDTRFPKVYNVAVDAHNCYPVSIEQIIKDIERYEKQNYQQ